MSMVQTKKKKKKKKKEKKKKKKNAKHRKSVIVNKLVYVYKSVKLSKAKLCKYLPINCVYSVHSVWVVY